MIVFLHSSSDFVLYLTIYFDTSIGLIILAKHIMKTDLISNLGELISIVFFLTKGFGSNIGHLRSYCSGDLLILIDIFSLDHSIFD